MKRYRLIGLIKVPVVPEVEMKHRKNAAQDAITAA